MSSAFVLSCIVCLMTLLFVLTRPVDAAAAPTAPAEIKDWFSETRSMLRWEPADNSDAAAATLTRHCRQLMKSFDTLQERTTKKRLWRSLSDDQQLDAMRCLMSHPLVRQKPVLETQLAHCDRMIVDVSSGSRNNNDIGWTRWWRRASQQTRGELAQCIYDRLLTHELASHFRSSWYPMGTDPLTGLERPAMLVWSRKEDDDKE